MIYVAPDGYTLPSGQWKVLVSKISNDDASELQITITGKDTPPAVIENTISGDTKYLIPNYEIPDIPSTGGIGIPHYKTYGLLLMIISIISLMINQLNQTKKQEYI